MDGLNIVTRTGLFNALDGRARNCLVPVDTGGIAPFGHDTPIPRQALQPTPQAAPTDVSATSEKRLMEPGNGNAFRVFRHHTSNKFAVPGNFCLLHDGSGKITVWIISYHDA
jgi:hypothetical protein